MLELLLENVLLKLRDVHGNKDSSVSHKPSGV